jgi:HrpA-like RNA helicase
MSESQEEEETVLPINSYRDEILQKIKDNRVVVICSDTGTGKSTKIPQFIMESCEKCRIIVS